MTNSAPKGRFEAEAHPRNETNGQFVEARKADPGSDLLNGDAQRFDWIADEELLHTTARIAGFAVGRAITPVKVIDLTVQDVQAELLSAMMGRRRRQVEAAELSEEEPVRIPEDSSEQAWAYTVAKSIVAKLSSRVTNSADWSALAEFNSRSLLMNRELGREPTTREEDALADEIRMSRPPRRRPSPGFHRIGARFASSLEWVMHDQYNEPVGPFGDLIASEVDTAEEALFAYEQSMDNTTREFEEGSYGDQALQLIESGVRRNHGPSRIAYHALAERRDAPMPAELSLREDQATAAKRTVREAGGTVAISRRIVAGQAHPKEVAALMAAFPSTERARAEEFAEVLLAHPAFAEEVWAGTIQYATIRNPRARLQKNTSTEGAVA